MTGFAGAKVLVTGGLGFIGSNIVRRLVDLGASVTVVDNLLASHGGERFNLNGVESDVNVQILDIAHSAKNRDLIQGNQYIFNLAGHTSHLGSMRNPVLDLRTNVVAQAALLETCRQVNPDARIVFASTRQVYGRPEYLPVDEHHPIRPLDVNGIGKLAAENLHLLYAEHYEMPTVVLRLSNVYGPRMRVADASQMFLGIWIRTILDGDNIRVFGDGEQERDLLYVDDCVEALLIAASELEKTNCRVFNVGGGVGLSLNAIAEALTAAVPGSRWTNVEFPSELRQIEIGNYCTDTRLFRAEFGWKPTTDLTQGLQLTIQYYRDFGDQYWAPAN